MSFRKGALGDEEFIKTYAPNHDSGVGEQNKEETSCSIESLVDVVCKEFEVTLDDLCSSDKRRELVQARGILQELLK